MKLLAGLGAAAYALVAVFVIVISGLGSPASLGGLDWAALARCESTGNPRAVDATGQHFGLYQFDLPTWHGLGGHGLPSEATPAAQTAMAFRLFQQRGIAPWPVCGHLLTDHVGIVGASRAGPIASAGLAPVFAWVPAGGYPTSSFPFGQCTWWAAYNHPVHWMGNAVDWLANASLAGYATSAVPTVGSIVVYFAGDRYSVFGHVGLVVAMQPGSFTVSEMNYAGLGVVDTRVNPWPDAAVEGFLT